LADLTVLCLRILLGAVVGIFWYELLQIRESTLIVPIVHHANLYSTLAMPYVPSNPSSLCLDLTCRYSQMETDVPTQLDQVTMKRYPYTAKEDVSGNFTLFHHDTLCPPFSRSKLIGRS